jgi:hypothetical protein
MMPKRFWSVNAREAALGREMPPPTNFAGMDLWFNTTLASRRA